MKIILKKILNILFIIMVIIIIFFLYSFLNHQMKTKYEMKYLKKYDVGKIIEINNKKINYKIFNEENNENTILLMGGSGVTDLSLSFEPLARDINAKIILINRYGYGFSDDSNEKATVENIVEFYRTVLKKLNISDKIFLMPHSISGMYAIYWAEVFPDEINGIIGLDIGSPYIYQDEFNNKLFNNISYLGCKIGIHRFIYKMGDDNTSIKNYDIYNDDYFYAIWYLNMINPYSKFNLSEENLVKDNANKVIKNMNSNYYNIKKLYIMADSMNGEFYEKFEKENMRNHYKDEEKIKSYISNIRDIQKENERTLSLDNNTTFMYIEGPHSLYYYPTVKLVEAINFFLED